MGTRAKGWLIGVTIVIWLLEIGYLGAKNPDYGNLRVLIDASFAAAAWAGIFWLVHRFVYRPLRARREQRRR